MNPFHEGSARARSRASITLAFSVVATVLAGCLAEAPTSIPKPPVPLPPTPFIVSDPVSVSPSATVLAPAGPQGSSATVWISLPVGSLPNANGVTIYVPSTGVQVSVIVTDGGFDPVGVVARAGDTLVAIVSELTPGKPTRYLMLVPATSAPVVIRSSPPPHRRDVPLNSIMMITFSEPMDSTSLVRAIGLRADSIAVVGTLKALVSGGVVFRAVFTPTDSLAPLTAYVLRVGRAAEDVQGDSLRAPVTVDFTTAADSSVVPPDSIPQPPDSTPQPSDTTPFVSILSPVAEDTLPVDFAHVRFMLRAGTYADLQVNLEDLDDSTNPFCCGGLETVGTVVIDSTEPWNYWGDRYPHLHAGHYVAWVGVTDVFGHWGSSTVQPVVLVDPDTTPRILVRSFSVVELGDSTGWLYAPQLVVSDASGQSGLQIVGFEMLDIPGLPQPFPGLTALPFVVPSDHDTPLLGEHYGDYDLSYFAPGFGRSTGGVATARLTYRDAANHYYAVNLQSPITPAQPLTTYTTGCGYFTISPLSRDLPPAACPAAVRQIAGASPALRVRPATRPHFQPARAHN